MCFFKAKIIGYYKLENPIKVGQEIRPKSK